MSFSCEFSLVPRLGMEVSPALVTFSELLLLPYAELQAVVEDQLADNGALERLDAGECPVCRGRWASRCPVCRTTPTAGSTWSGPADLADLRSTEGDTVALRRAVGLEVDAGDAVLAEYLVSSLDHHGMLDGSYADLAARCGVDESSVARVVATIRRVGPPGVGATTIEECLLLQLEALEVDEGLAALARQVIEGHLPALARGHHAAIARALGVGTAEVADVLALIRCRLRPHPAFDGDGGSAPSFVVPDLVVRPHDQIPGEFVVELVEPAVTRLAVRPRTERDSSGPGGSAAQARSFLGLLADRWATLRRVAELAVSRQRRFLLEGASALEPLTRAEAAAELGLHESTVSRTVSGKYVLLPDRSLVPLSRFFAASGGLDGTLRTLVESAPGPVSDHRLAELLADAGYRVARRTVAKHRARLGIAPAALR
jgi:RNA polymerase sigma-54 factor